MMFLEAPCRTCRLPVTRVVWPLRFMESRWHHATVAQGIACRQLRPLREEDRRVQPDRYTIRIRHGEPPLWHPL